MTSKCVICFGEHDRIHGERAALYCETCVVLKHDSVHVVSPIWNNLHLSGLIAASSFDGMRLCVHECVPHYDGPFIHIPILSKRPNGPTDRSGAVVNLDKLNEAVDVIEDYMNRGEKLLVHCKGGVERSPLTVAWYLVHRAKQFTTLNQAYGYLKSKRPVVSPRLIWLPS